MRRRSRAEGGQQLVETQVLSTDATEEPLAPVHSEASPPYSVRRRLKRTLVAVHSQPDNASHEQAEPAPETPPAPVNVALNAFWSKDQLVLVVPDSSTANGVSYRRQKAEHSCFIRRVDMKDPEVFTRMLNSHQSVRKAVWEGDWLRVCWADKDALKHYCKGLHERGVPTFEGGVSPVLRYMVDNGVRPARPRPAWIDIETDSRVAFGRAIEGGARILSWALVDAQAQVISTGMLEEDTDEDEKRILEELWVYLEHYDQVAAWAGDRFDFPVIKARSQRYNLLQPTTREWRRWLWLDHLELFKRMNMNVSESGDEKQSYKLNVIAETVLGRGKEDFDSGKTWEAWAAGGEERKRLMRYNITDARLMPEIEKVTGYIELLQTVADTCGTFPDSRGAQPGVQVEGFLARLAQERDYKFPTVLKSSDNLELDKYLGAYVLHPEKKAGIHRDVHVADFAALYPSIIRTWNMSPETVVDGEDTTGFEHPTCLSSLTGHRFRTDIAGVLPEAVKQLMELRAAWNKKKALLPPGTEAWKEADRRAGAYKIATNSFYGVIGSPMSRFYDRRVAESITQCGKWLIVETIRAAERQGMKVIYGDTDSLFVVGATRVEFETFVSWCNTDLYPKILQEQGCIDNVVKLAYEKQFDRLIISTAKKYLGNFVHYKGAAATAESTPEIKGLEFKRGDSLKIARQMQEEICHLLVGFKQAPGEHPSDYEAIVQKWQDYVLEERLELGDVLVSKSTSRDLDKYAAQSNALVRIGRMMEERGSDVGEGAKINYVVVDASVSPQEVIPADDYDPDVTQINRAALWDKHVWPATERLLESAFPAHPWDQLGGLAKAKRKLQRQLESQRLSVQRKLDKEMAKKAARETLEAERLAAQAPAPAAEGVQPGRFKRTRRTG